MGKTYKLNKKEWDDDYKPATVKKADLKQEREKRKVQTEWWLPNDKTAEDAENYRRSKIRH